MSTLSTQQIFMNNPIAQRFGYDTVLSPQQELTFRKVMTNVASKYPNFADWNQPISTRDYDYRAAFLAGQLTPSGDAHLSDVGKLPWHPAFSNESVYSYSDAPFWLGVGDTAQRVVPFNYRR